MASVQTKDQPAPLSLGLATLNSSQPFPSPGSSFLPPPVPGPHEFAIRPPSAGRKMSKKDGEDLSGDVSTSRASTFCNGNATTAAITGSSAGVVNDERATGSATSPNGVVSPTRAPLSFISSFLPRFIVSMLNIPRSVLRVLHLQEPATPTPTSSASGSESGTSSGCLEPSTPTPHTPTEFTYASPDRRALGQEPQPQDARGSDPLRFPQPQHRLSTQSVTSLTSSRPAPPSPAMSRRASGLSRASSRTRSRPVSGVSGSASRPVSGAAGSRPASGVLTRPVSGSLAPGGSSGLSRTPSGRRGKDVLGMSSVAESKEREREKERVAAATDDLDEEVELIKIRDYGFASSDPRFTGEGSHVPRANRPKVLARRLRRSSTSSSSSSSSSEENQWEDEQEGGVNGWGQFKWGFGRGWGFGARGSVTAAESDFPSRGDFDRNFADPDEDEGEGEVYDDAEDLSDEQYDDEEQEGEPALLPGLYRAIYAFEPEGIAEMKLDEDQVVRVVGRGGGVGWAVAVKGGLKDNGVHALVPESYLEVVRLDGDEEE
ncbi:hypothetical protein HYDPIDRAFT_32882 [Hydnomerulius pinastri MD-312]|uniref:SH3 domain-containing protein n=1 Tax=Hydnomerulius pinastri MD-312 TaxID=994086 RepID=A0A0C9V394_9AGAM|nr:hypothetical protein HYDPIDRAFT_32882 [Hydnomerulius pinastri MD-312]